MNATLTRITRLATACLTCGLAAPSMAALCQDVTFTFNNSHLSGGPIKVKKIKYRDITANQSGIVENIVDKTCANGSTCTTVGEDLTDVFTGRLGHDLTNFQFQYQAEDALGNWLPAVWSKKFVPTDTECRNDRDYGGSTWVITG
jgi:hypothetical protein